MPVTRRERQWKTAKEQSADLSDIMPTDGNNMATFDDEGDIEMSGVKSEAIVHSGVQLIWAFFV